MQTYRVSFFYSPLRKKNLSRDTSYLVIVFAWAKLLHALQVGIHLRLYGNLATLSKPLIHRGLQMLPPPSCEKKNEAIKREPGARVFYASVRACLRAPYLLERVPQLLLTACGVHGDAVRRHLSYPFARSVARIQISVRFLLSPEASR